jgi:AAA ATPase domain
MHSKAKADVLANRYNVKGLPFREPKNAYDHTAFPVDNLPNIRTDQFFGREASIERIDKHLGDWADERLRTYLIYGRRGVGKTQIALEYARRYKSKFDAVFWASPQLFLF